MKNTNNSFKKHYLNLCQFTIIMICSIIFCKLNAQPTLKSSFSFPSTLGHGDSEDWPTSVFSSSDCLHFYFAGFSVYEGSDDCNHSSVEVRAPILGKINHANNELVWEREYNVVIGEGEFQSVMEMGGFIWAAGVQKDCNGATHLIILKANSDNGDPEQDYPKFFDPPLDANYTIDNSRMFPIIENGVLTGMYGTGRVIKHGENTHRAMIFITDTDGELDTNFGENGFFIGSENTESRKLIKITGSSTIQYIYIGEKFIAGTDYDVLLGALDASGKSVDWGETTFSETSLQGIYTDDLTNDASICSGDPDRFENKYEWGWDVLQEGDNVFLSCIFDYVAFNSPTTDCQEFTGHDTYSYEDIALLKVSISDGTVLSAVNVGVSEAADFYPDIEIRNGKIFVLGAKSRIENGDLKTDGKLSTYDTDLDLIAERTFSNDDWKINCSFQLAFDCNDQIIISGNNDKNDEDYSFYKFSNDCQSNVTLSGDDIAENTTISGSVTWSSSRKVKATIRVADGGVLTINSGAVIEFGSSWDLVDYNVLAENDNDTKAPRIIVENGGHLALYNCTLRGLSDCSNNSMWDGVEVRNGGGLLFSNSTIQDAKFGILADIGSYNIDGQLNPTESDGGGSVEDLYGSGSTILNCRRGVHFASSGAPNGGFAKTKFLCTGFMKDPNYKTVYNNLVQKLGTSIFVSANDVSGLFFSGCEWENSAYLPADLRGIGISTFNSAFDFSGTCKMTNLNIGINAEATDPTKFITVTESNEFTGNKTGILLKGGNLHKIAGQNTFVTKIGVINNIQSPGVGIGVYNAGSNKVFIEDNTFTAGSSVDYSSTYGIISENTGSASSIHKKNHFTNIEFGDQTQKDNGGLNLWCNDHTQNSKAWFINPLTSGAFPNQGICLTILGLTPENKFIDAACQTSLNHIHSTVAFDYWINNSEPNPPTCISTIVSTPTCNPPNLLSGCDASIQLTRGNLSAYFNEVSSMSEGAERELLVNDLIRHYILYERVDTVLMLLANESNENYKMAYALLLLKLGDVNEAQDVVETLSTSSAETQSFTDFFNTLVFAYQNELELSELPTQQISELEDIAENRTFGGYSAQVVLTKYFGKEYPSILETEEGIEYRSKKDQNRKANITKNFVYLTPNPASDLVNLKYDIVDKPPFDFEILSVEGKKYFQKPIYEKIGQILFDLEALPKGVYILNIRNREKNLASKRFIKY